MSGYDDFVDSLRYAYGARVPLPRLPWQQRLVLFLRRLLCPLVNHRFFGDHYRWVSPSGESKGMYRRCPCGRNWAKGGLPTNLSAGDYAQPAQWPLPAGRGRLKP